MKKKLMLGGGVLGIVAVAALVYMLVLGGGGDSEAAQAEPTPVSVEGKLGPHIILKERVFNLAPGPGGTKAFLKLGTTIEFETTDPKWFTLAGEPLELALEEFSADEIGGMRYVIEDVVTSVVSGKSAATISTREGKDQLREEIKAEIGKKLAHPKVHSVLFTLFITD